MYPSDYGFATSGGSTTNRSSCLAVELYGWNSSSVSDCINNSWLYDSSSTQWTLSPFSSVSFVAFYIEHGRINGSNRSDVVSISYGVRPTLYLLSDVEIASGIGTSTDPYILK